MLRLTIFSILSILFANSVTGQPREFKRCPNGYRFVDGRCHTFGYHDHALRYHEGHFFKHSQPATRARSPQQ